MSEEQSRPGCRIAIELQVDSLRALAPGWYDESSPAYDASSLAWLGNVLLGLLDGFQLPRPYVYPTPERLARAEWSGPAWNIVASFDLDSRSVEVMAARTTSDEMHEITLALADADRESELGCFLAEHLATE